MLLELAMQILKEPCFNVLRTQEQLGYIVFSGVRRSHGVQGLRFIVQSEKPRKYLVLVHLFLSIFALSYKRFDFQNVAAYVDGRIEAFLHSMEVTLLVIMFA